MKWPMYAYHAQWPCSPNKYISLVIQVQIMHLSLLIARATPSHVQECPQERERRVARMSSHEIISGMRRRLIEQTRWMLKQAAKGQQVSSRTCGLLKRGR